MEIVSTIKELRLGEGKDLQSDLYRLWAIFTRDTRAL